MHGLHQVRARDPSDPIIPKGSVSLKEGAVRAWAYALAFLVLGFPVFSPDLFWHLSAGRWILAHASVPRVDPFSFSASGVEWIDFEWGLQVVWYAVHSAVGARGLWLLKVLLLAVAFWPVDGLLRDQGASPLARVGALTFWCAAILPQADLRADLVSAALFAWILRRLEAGRASFLVGFGAFALWSNLHAGFPLGFPLYALYALRERRAESLAAEATGAVLGSLLNPFGIHLYSVLLAHGRDAGLSRFVMEWGPPSWDRAFQVPLLAALAVTVAALWAGRGRASRALETAAIAFGLATVLSARFGVYFAATGAACVFSLFPRPGVRVVAAGLTALSLLLIPVLSGVDWGASFQDGYVARRAVEFVVRERAALGGLRLFNQYEWGGYLGWRMGDGYRVFGDGRYLFHRQLPEIQAALASAGSMAALAERHGLDGFLIKNDPLRLPSTRQYPDGTRREIARPWHVFIFPRERWALVYWDDQALLFLDRAKAAAGWLAAHEYRWLRPGDEAALADALSRGEVPLGALGAERARFRAETER